MVCVFAFVFSALVCSAFPFSASAASLISNAAQLSMRGANVALGAYSRSNTVAALSLLEQEKFEEATESLVQAAITLGFLDIGAGFLLPMTEKLVDYVMENSAFGATRQKIKLYTEILKREAAKGAHMDKKLVTSTKKAIETTLSADIAKLPSKGKIAKAFAKVGKWLKGASVFDVLGPISDLLTIGVNFWGLDIAIKDKNTPGIVAASLSIAAGVIGIAYFIGAVVTGSAILGPIGAIGGAIIGIGATLIELFGGPGYDKAAVEEYYARLRRLRSLGDACIATIDKRMEFLEHVGANFTDVYVNNQASSITAIGRGELDFIDSTYLDDYGVAFNNSFWHRKYHGDANSVGSTHARKLLKNGTFVCIGHFRWIQSPYMPLDSSSTGWGKTLDGIGFDFYGKYKKNSTIGGVYLFINSNFIQGEQLNAFVINTYKHRPGSFREHIAKQDNDVISINDYKKFHKFNEIEIYTNFGSDCLNINGMIGEFHDDYKDKFTAVLGFNARIGYNMLSFRGMTKEREHIKGVFYDSKTHVLKYFHGENRDSHTLGKVFDVSMFHGSPFDDHVVLFPHDFKVYQTSGSNVYEIHFDEIERVFRDRSSSHEFEITDQSKQPFKINLDTTENIINKNDLVLSYSGFNILEIYGAKGRYTHVPKIKITLKNGTTNGYVFINNEKFLPLDHSHMFIRRISGVQKNLNITRSPHHVNFPENNRDDLLLLNCSAEQDLVSGNYTVDMKGGIDAVIISDKYLLDPCGIDGDTVTLMVRDGPQFESKDTFLISIEKSEDDDEGTAFRVDIEMRNVERVINEYSDRLLAFDVGHRAAMPIDLYEDYIDTTSRTLGVESAFFWEQNKSDD